MAALDSLLQRLPMHLAASAEPAQLPPDASIVSAIEAMRPRVRNDALHEALGELLRTLEGGAAAPAGDRTGTGQ